MRRYKDETPAVRVYTVCDESRYLIVRNVPALGCGDDLMKLFANYGDIDECKPMDAEDCEAFTDVYFVKFHRFSNARFAKRKLDKFVFLGNRLEVSYAPHFESVDDTKDKLENRRKDVLARLNSGRSKGPTVHDSGSLSDSSLVAAPSQFNLASQQRMCEKMDFRESQSICQVNGSSIALYVDSSKSQHIDQVNDLPITRVSSDKDYFSSQSMNQTVRFVREKLNKIESSTEHLQVEPASKKMRVDNRRRI
ncbi:RNA-binding protein 48-like [Mangifera indica]|uniref:RNA-binding protein 48-like n=1 Tax=Mangifera indica TaxID=29780 RepID=UPI001CF9E73D|nr:RNA-binding protein 48-like [Mangifera indica]XP_044490515.1 RNA-binding protein 48-like [Mangifera indica]XP_044490516.1 RNA-binding protein 48-like [Mangifera indica]XP_044490517.1 RNA-binding protein 48-like [Mangifera indica]XP_044490518.1 RNA-binding protein 48-like [Mangifera indica]XP_044490519.1 RNA-binding protein 48-like [Mangifera indica]XP_044490520.1 RNA-binding protein 48-like [Mangifera indica]XP_044490521.1 RNA-binding protein 48-like [Mangifera indica]XP_044490522.1 RNA-